MLILILKFDVIFPIRFEYTNLMSLAGLKVFFGNWLNEHIIVLYFSFNVLLAIIRQNFLFNFY